MSIRIYAGDEVNVFSHALDEQSIKEFIKFRYTKWTSRVIIEIILVYVSKNIYLWKICNILMYMLWSYSIYKITNMYSGVILGMIMLYPIIDMSSAGWIATSLNYFWPLVFGTYSFVTVNKIISEKKVKVYEIILSIVAEIIAVNMEQYAVLHIICLVIITVYLLIKKDFAKGKYGIVLIHFTVSFISIIVAITCPGNNARKVSETIRWMKNFGNLSVLDKIICGYNTTISGFLSQCCLLFIIFLIILLMCVVKKSINDSMRYWIVSISAIPLIMAVIVSIGHLFKNEYFTYISNALSQGTIINAENWNKPINYAIFILYVLFTFFVLFSIIYIFDDVFIGIVHGGVFLGSVLTRMVLGFSPTLYVSSRRTFCFSYGIVIYISIKILKEMGSLFKDKELNQSEILLFGASCVFILEMVARICGAY